MSRKNRKKEEQQKQITGSGADVKLIEHDQGMVKCKCIVPCVWRGYRDEGDTVWIEKEMIEKDAFIKAHFKAVCVDHGGSTNQDGGTAAGEGETAADGEGGTAAGEGETAADGEGGTAANGDGQDELDLK